jgi:hypothetical protein
MVSRYEPRKFEVTEIHKDCLQILEQKQWLNFLGKFEGFCEAVALDFAYSFDGQKATIGNFTLRVNEDSLALVIGLPQTGEKYFKTKHFKDKSWVPFISRSRVSSVNWKKGIPRSWLVHPWDELAYLIQKFITCEGRFSIIYLYHIKLLQHLRGDCEINMPYFLLQSLSKMAKTVQKQDRNTVRSLYHCGLIKMIVKNELLKQNMNWQQFTTENGFETVKEEEEEEHILVRTDDDDDDEDDEEEEQHPKATSPKLPLGRRTRSMVLKEKELAEKEKIFTTYERRTRKRPQVQKGQTQEEDDRAQQAQYEHIQTLEAQTFDEIFEAQETPTYAQMKVDMEQLIHDMKEEPQIEEAAGTSTTELDRKNKKIRKMKRKIKEIEVLERYIKTENEMLRIQSHRTQEENDSLKKKNKKLQKQNKLISQQAYKWFQQKKVYKEKYKKMKALQTVQTNVETLLQAAEAAEEQ